MTTISLKLIGNPDYIIINTDKKEITILDIFNYLLRNDLAFNEISKITFIHNGRNITDDTSAKYTGTEDEPLIIYMHTDSEYIKTEILKNIYNKEEDNKEESDNDYDELTEEEINKKNEEIIKLFSDKDFTYLLKICLDKPELLNTVTSYITNGNISIEIKLLKEDDEFKHPNELEEILKLLNKLNINIDINDIKSIIQHFEGHLNLSLRYILNKNDYLTTLL
jgi:hypothetical protein